MNARRIERFDGLARLFRYPGDDYADRAAVLLDHLNEHQSRAAEPMREFARYVVEASLDELEETYTRTFDLNPSCSAEIGWHLFGEEYVRGLFMVHMRQQMRDRGLEETGELPDHLAPVLRVLAAMDDDPAREMARACVCPAVGKMLASLDREEAKTGAAPQPFRPLVSALAELVLEEFGLPRSALEAQEDEPNPLANGEDPLRSYPCGGCGQGEVVPLEPVNRSGAQPKESLR